MEGGAASGGAEPRAAKRRVTIVDVAERAGVSTASASNVLRNAYGVSPQMRARVESAMAELGYRPMAAARGMRGKTFTIGVLVSDLHNPFYALVVEGLTDLVAESGYELLVGPGGSSPDSQLRMVQALVDRQMDGVILIGPVVATADIERIAASLPTVIVGLHGPAEKFDTVAGDDRLGIRLAVDHLVALGHRRIAYLTYPSSGGADVRTPQLVREQGFIEAMRAHGLGEFIDLIPTPWTHQGGVDAARGILARTTLPTAVIGGADVAAIGLLSEFWERGVDVPGRVSVLGYDNTATAALPQVSLTSIDQEGIRMGRSAARLLLGRIGGRTVAEHILTVPKLMLRRTSAASPAPETRTQGIAP